MGTAARQLSGQGRGGVRGERQREGMAEGRWIAGVWVVAEPEFSAPWCAGCPRCRGWYLRERAKRVFHNAEVVLSGARRRAVAAKRVLRRSATAKKRARRRSSRSSAAETTFLVVARWGVRRAGVGTSVESSSTTEGSSAWRSVFYLSLQSALGDL